MAHDVFISYASEDRVIGDAICFALEDSGIECWMAPRDIEAGRSWSSTIIDAIGRSRVMILVLTAKANTSKQVIREIERAVNQGVTVLPFRVEEIKLSKDLEYFLSMTHWLDAFTEPLDTHLKELFTSVQSLLRESTRMSSVGDTSWVRRLSSTTIRQLRQQLDSSKKGEDEPAADDTSGLLSISQLCQSRPQVDSASRTPPRSQPEYWDG